MKYTELKSDIAACARGIYLLEGDDAYFRMKGAEAVIAAFVDMPELNYASFEGESLKGANLTALISAIESVPFISEKRVTKITDFHPSESDYENYLKKTFENMPEYSVLLIVNAESGNGVDLKRKKCVTYFDCNRADEETVTKWVYVTLKRAGVLAHADACKAVASYCLSDMSRVALEVEKIIDYKGGGELTREEVDELVFKDADYRIYEMTNAVAYRNFDKFRTIEAELCKKTGDEVILLSSLFSYFKNLLAVITSRSSDAELAKQLKMKEYGVKKSREQAFAIGEERLTAFVKCIYSRMADIKCGAMTPQSALQNVNNAIFFQNS